jgi:hypothetical protein
MIHVHSLISYLDVGAKLASAEILKEHLSQQITLSEPFSTTVPSTSDSIGSLGTKRKGTQDLEQLEGAKKQRFLDYGGSQTNTH